MDSRDRGKDYDRRSRDRDRYHERDRGYERERDRDIERTRSYDSRSRRRSRSRSQERSRDYDRHRYICFHVKGNKIWFYCSNLYLSIHVQLLALIFFGMNQTSCLCMDLWNEKDGFSLGSGG